MHLTDKQFDEDLESVIVRAVAAGVERILTLGTDVESSRAAIKLAQQYPQIYAAVGIHPEAVRHAAIDQLEIIRDLASDPKVVAIGEIGLDYYWDKDGAELQRAFFERQLDLSIELELPISIHDRDAHRSIMETLESRKGLVRGVLHSFSGDSSMARWAIDMGLYMSFSGPVTFLNARLPAEVVGSIPLDRMLLETDSPYLAPHPLRGRRNEPANVELVARRVAELKGIAVDQVAAGTTGNARELFGF